MDIDRQRVAAVRLLEALGYAWRGGEWQSPKFSWAEPDGMHAGAALVRRFDALAGCLDSPEQEEAELQAITVALEAYEAKHYVAEVHEPHHCRMVSLSDAQTPAAGRRSR
jgi:hypothetical protein